jgi:hypothetical protein
MRGLRTIDATWSLLLACTAALACGRSKLYASEELAFFPGNSGSGGTPVAAGGSSGRGGAPGGTAGRAGMSGSGGVSVAGSAGQAGNGGVPQVCMPEILEVAPANGAPSLPGLDWASARYGCVVAPGQVRTENAQLYGSASGYLALGFPAGDDKTELWLDPLPRSATLKPYFAGERVTAWLGEKLGGPYLWQFTAAVSLSGALHLRPNAQDLSELGLARGTALGDFDRDGDLDVVVQDDQALAFLRNNGDGTFAQREMLPGGQGTPVAGDLDRDGDLDVVAGGQLLLNDGAGQFIAGSSFGACTAMGDLDGDGDLDCIANDGYRDTTPFGHVAFNHGRFSVGPETPFGFECEIADLDGDADLDAACVSPVVEAGRIFLNDGHGAFTRSEQVLGEVGARGMALGDLDADGDVDAVVSHWFGAGRTSPNQIWLNDGKGRFREVGSIGADGGSIALADLDGDGDFDALFSHLTPYGPNTGPFNPIRIYLNDGAAHFENSQVTLGDPAYHWFTLGDLDQDGDLDAFVFHQIPVGGNYSAVWLNE